MKLTINRATIITYLTLILIVLLMSECFMLGGRVACQDMKGVYGNDLKCRIKEPQESNIIIPKELKLNNYLEDGGHNNS